MTIEQLKAEMLKRPSDFGYYGDLDLSVWGFAPFTQHRDSDLLAQSNFDAALKELKAVSAKSVEVMHCSHWAVGWLEHIMVRTTATKTMAKVLELYLFLRDAHPVLDEEDYSRRQHEQACEAYEAWAKYDIRRLAEENEIGYLLDEDGWYEPSEKAEEYVKEALYEAIMDHDPHEGTYDECDLLAKLRYGEYELTKDTQTLTLPF